MKQRSSASKSLTRSKQPSAALLGLGVVWSMCSFGSARIDDRPPFHVTSCEFQFDAGVSGCRHQDRSKRVQNCPPCSAHERKLEHEWLTCTSWWTPVVRLDAYRPHTNPRMHGGWAMIDPLLCARKGGRGQHQTGSRAHPPMQTSIQIAIRPASRIPTWIDHGPRRQPA